MKAILNFDGPVQKLISRIGDFALLNLIWLICSLPIVTIGATTTAMISVMFKIAEGKSNYVLKEYFRALKENWRQSTIAWLILLAGGIFLYFDYQAITKDLKGNLFFLVFFGLVTMVYLFVSFYLFPCIARFKNSLKQHFRNALYISLANLPITIGVLVIGAAIACAFYFSISAKMFFLVLYVCLLLGVSIVCYLMATIWLRVFRKYEH